MDISRINKSNRTTLPLGVCDALQIDVGDLLEWRVVGDTVFVGKAGAAALSGQTERTPKGIGTATTTRR